MKSEQEDNRNVAMDFLVTLMHAWALVSRSISGPWLLVHHFYKAIVFICMGSLLVSELIAIGIGGDDMLTLSLNTCVMLSNAVAIYKNLLPFSLPAQLVLSTVWPGRYRSLVAHVVRSLPDYLSHDAAGRRRLVADSRTAYTFTMGFVVCGHVTVASWSLLPLLLKPVEKLRLPLVAWTPFDSSCGLGFLHTLTIETIAKYLSYMASILLQIFCYCWFGDSLSSKSTAVARVAYSCAWTRGSAGFGRSLCILMARAQRPLIVSGGSFYILSREAFIRILNASYSYFAVLYSMSDK
ncbi:uncharacterized protein LOC126485019 [Schistocerca serialis cubense]|uniref:uncharacterized protein LOC126485019 n=1 Tax=Schistocerca serialis cubense TaxID=2023355 RepID=UPI00214F5F17|nr:uncharacterized protein LOC126485019 [Schistocerca serialis cubense]